mmetsp:Transcript_9418/g.17602  ORF Transcript_9418/g.17602 Transcript_9418/m.17602 type:complete len:227 (-) Transcript_9418:416-1096(-)
MRWARPCTRLSSSSIGVHSHALRRLNPFERAAVGAQDTPRRRPANSSFFSFNSERRAMAWRSHGKDNDSLVAALKGSKVIASKSVEEAMKAVDRGYYTLEKSNAYMDSPQPIGKAATISAPHMHGYCLELLKDHLLPGNKALDVGSGSGYLTSVFAHMVGKEGKAVGVEHIPDLVKQSLKNTSRDPATSPLLQSGNLELLEADGKSGHATEAPYDCKTMTKKNDVC